MRLKYFSIFKLQRLHRRIWGMVESFHTTFYGACDYLSMIGLKLIRAGKFGPWWTIISSNASIHNDHEINVNELDYTLTHWGLNKMSHTFLKGRYYISIWNSINFIPKCQFHNKLELVEIMGCVEQTITLTSDGLIHMVRGFMNQQPQRIGCGWKNPLAASHLWPLWGVVVIDGFGNAYLDTCRCRSVGNPPDTDSGMHPGRWHSACCYDNGDHMVHPPLNTRPHLQHTSSPGVDYNVSMMTSSNGNLFRVTGPLCGEITGHRWIPCTKASDAELWYFLWSASV